MRAIAPFLSWDGDAYPAIVDGRIQWIVDGYTTTDRYPYAQRAITDGTGGLSGTFNYVRNSVKAVIDAYDGTITLYIVDHNDPIIRAYQKAFPHLFSTSDPSEDLRRHFRYPEDLFRVQTNMWGRYHLNNPDEFYTNGNSWTVAPDPGTVTQTSASSTSSGQDNTANVQDTSNRIAPYYQLLHLQDDNALNFVILRPFVPLKGNNQQMTAFMVARSDPQNYGQLTTYVMPGNSPPPAPTLVASNMSSDTNVGQLQTLLGIRGGGSDLLFGNLITVPIQQSLLYVRPVYVKASRREQPAVAPQGGGAVQQRRQGGGHVARRVEALPAVRGSPDGHHDGATPVDDGTCSRRAHGAGVARTGVAGLPGREQRAQARRLGHLQAEDRRRREQDPAGPADPRRQRADTTTTSSSTTSTTLSGASA